MSSSSRTIARSICACRHLLAVAVVLGTCASARAQSAVDGFDPGANGSVSALAVQADGKILVGGSFTSLGGGTGSTARYHIGRLNADGSLDTSFDPGANDTVAAIVVQADGKILVGGAFTTLGGGGTGVATRNYIGRLNADGSLDASFDPGANAGVNAVALQRDGKVLVGGFFTMLGGGGTGSTPRNDIGRLNADGSLDAAFNPAGWPNPNDHPDNANIVETIAVQADGKILIGSPLVGSDVTDVGLRRLNADGSLDTSFSPDLDPICLFFSHGIPPSCAGGVKAVAVQPDGKMVVGGGFRFLFERLNVDGSRDISFPIIGDNFVALAQNHSVDVIAVQPDGKILFGGDFQSVGVSKNIGRVNADGSLDLTFRPGANAFVSAIAVQPDGKVLVGGGFSTLGGGGTGTTARHGIGRLYADGSVDSNFDPGANGSVETVVVQADGKTVVGGSFTALDGGTGTTTRNRLGRLNADGSLDPNFNPGANANVLALAAQPDGKILVGGAFTALGGGTGPTTRNHIGRLSADGSPDAFDPGANSTISAVAVQADGKILVGGSFTTVGGGGTGTTMRNGIARLNADGTLDAGFDPGANGTVSILVLQPDGKIVIGGGFTTLGGGGTGTMPRNHLGRLNADGSLDAAFDPGANGDVVAVAVQADGKILVGGAFTLLGGGGTGTTPRSHLGRLNADGSLDAAFDPGANGIVQTLGIQADGKILAGGVFTTPGGGAAGTTTRNRIGRLNADGSLDLSFDPGANGLVETLAVQADAKVLVGGTFTTLGGGGEGATSRNRIGRLTNTVAALQSLEVVGGGRVVTWLRSGAGPEVWRVTFESSIDGATYTALGSGTRTPGGWQLSGQRLPTARNQFIRARGYVATGSIVESIRQVFIEHPPMGDVDGDRIADLVVYRPDSGVWFQRRSTTNFTTTTATQFGLNGDVPVAGDYDGDGKTDLAVWRPSTGTWYILQSSSGFTASVSFQLGLSTDIPVPGDYDGDRFTDLAIYRPSTGVWYIRQSSSNLVVTAALGIGGDVPVPADYDGDGTTDVAVYRPATGMWFVRQSSTSSRISLAIQWGLNGDVPVPGYYDGDQAADLGVWRPSIGVWFIRHSSTRFTTSYQWGLNGDIAVPGDYDGDGTTDLAVYRPATGVWYIRLSTTGYATSVPFQLGLPGDVPAPNAPIANAIAIAKPATSALANLARGSDFDGDGRSDLTVYRPSDATWWTLQSATGYTTATTVQWGSNGDLSVPGDYDGDGKTDSAVYRPGICTWFILLSGTNFTSSVAAQWGVPGDLPVPGDYDGDGKTDPAVFRPSTGVWYILNSGGNLTTFATRQWGLSGDVPVPGDYDGDGLTDPAVYRPSTGVWYIRYSSTGYATFATFQWGIAGDITVPGDYDGDGRTDLAVYRPSTGVWFIRPSATNFTTLVTYQWGLSGDIPVPGDFDGDGKTDLAVFRPSSGAWFFLKSSTNFTASGGLQWGVAGDVPILGRQ